MDEWQFFPLPGHERPGTASGYTEAERFRLEFAVAKQVTFLLSGYSQIRDTIVDIPTETEAEETISLRTLQFPPIILADNSELLIGQLPWKDDHEEFKPGFHSVTQTNDHDQLMQAITVRDPSHNHYPPIYNRDGTKIEFAVLQELFEVLDILIRVCVDEEEPQHQPPLDTSAFPTIPEDAKLESIGALVDGTISGFYEF